MILLVPFNIASTSHSTSISDGIFSLLFWQFFCRSSLGRTSILPFLEVQLHSFQQFPYLYISLLLSCILFHVFKRQCYFHFFQYTLHFLLWYCINLLGNALRGAVNYCSVFHFRVFPLLPEEWAWAVFNFSPENLHTTLVFFGRY